MSEQEDYSLAPFLEREQTKENTLAAYKAGLEAGAARAAPKWVSVKEALPKVEKDVLLLRDGGRVLSGWRGEGDEMVVKFWDFVGEITNVTHWLPLPPAPKQDGEK